MNIKTLFQEYSLSLDNSQPAQERLASFASSFAAQIVRKTACTSRPSAEGTLYNVKLAYQEIKQMSSQDQSSLIELTANSVNNTRLTQNHLSDCQLSKLTLPAHCLTAKLKKAHVAHQLNSRQLSLSLLEPKYAQNQQ